MADFPTLKPSSRTVDLGDWPQQKIRAQSGEETRILYGTKKTGMTLNLTYQNILDDKADDFLKHYDDMKGTYTTFALKDETSAGYGGRYTAAQAAGGTASVKLFKSSDYGNAWRYAGPPQFTQTAVGRSTVQVKLVAVL